MLQVMFAGPPHLAKPSIAYAVVVAAVALAALAVLTLITPGCSGPPSSEPCNFLELSKRAVDRSVGGFNPHFEVVAVDYGASVYVRQPYQRDTILHSAGVLIDKRSCRVCDIHKYGGALDYEGRTIVARMGPGPEVSDARRD